MKSQVTLAVLLLTLASPEMTSTSAGVSAEDGPAEKMSASVPGQILLGGMFPMHEHDISRKDYPCGAIKEEKGIQVGPALL